MGSVGSCEGTSGTLAVAIIRQHLNFEQLYLCIYPALINAYNLKSIAVKICISSISFTMVKLNLITAWWLAGGRKHLQGRKLIPGVYYCKIISVYSINNIGKLVIIK